MDLSMEVTAVRGVGPKTAAELHKSGIFTLRDLVYYLPRDYENFQAVSRVADLRPGKVVIKGQIKNLSTRQARRRRLTITEAEIYDDSGSVRVVWFNQAYRAKQLHPKKTYFFTGQFGLSNGRFQLTSPTATLVTETDAHAGLHPIYPARGALKPATFRKLIENLRGSLAEIPDLIPIIPNNPDFVKPGVRGEALFNVHFPNSPEDITAARQYLAYEEVFSLILAAALNKQENQKLTAPALPFRQAETKQLVQSLPFDLTPAQRRAAWDILQDLAKPTPMNRLLQGDVGAGKTVVAALAAHQVALSGHQTALLAPTAILATQHAETLARILEPFGVRVALLTGATKKKPTLKRQIAAGQVDLIVGTHALLTDDTQFKSLALCIIDEQHRFGVAQRQKLLTKVNRNKVFEGGPQVTTEEKRGAPVTTGRDDAPRKSLVPIVPHLLSMTATPIPRSLQLTIFGDLDVSIINQLPKGRQPITTKILPETSQRADLYPHIRATLAQNQQVYWICPAIDDSPQQETASVKKQAAKLAETFPHAKVAFLHGRMKPAEKDQIMSDFAVGKTDILVSTTVVEVGVDVPNATTIVIMNAENYGLAQLHQLRGRVGRGTAASFCFLITPADHEPSRRLRELEKSTDGFHLAEVDLKLRGPGEIYGNLQHGALDLRIASITDTQTIALASRQAKAFAKHPQDMVKYPELARSITTYQQLTTLN